MSQVKAMLRHEAFCLLGTPPISAMSSVGNNPMIAVIGGKLVKVDSYVNPEVSIIGLSDGKAKPGELVILEAKLSNESPEYIKKASIKWTVVEKNQEKVCWTDGKKVIFGAGVEKTTISVNAKLTLIYLVDTAEIPLTCEATQLVQVGDASPTPNPGPTPGPDSNLTGFPKQVQTWAVALVDSDTRAKSAKALASSFKDVSNKIGTGDLNNLRSVLKISKTKNNEALIASGVDPRKWDGWGSNLQDALYNKYVNGEMTKVGDIKKIWWEVSHGVFNSK